MKKFLSTPLGKCLLAAWSLGILIWSVVGLVDIVRVDHTQRLARGVAAAVTELEKSPPGRERAERFVNRLKAIDAPYAYADVQSALNAYAAALDEVIKSSIGTGRVNILANQEVAVEAERLKASIRKRL